MALQTLRSPRGLDQMKREELDALAREIREQIVQTVAKNGGHLSSNLGVVELTIALHRAFDCPEDKLVFDVGHQCYPHKLLTGRAQMFDTLRQTDGVCGFPRAEESVYDAYDTGHASTAISAALGFARARDLQGGDYHVVAVVGDGAMTGGMCYEALNDAGSSKTRLIVILNDNNMSISDSVGALCNYLTYLRVSKGWVSIKRVVSKFLSGIPLCGQALCRLFQRFKDHLRNIFIHDRFFSALGFRYLGPIDGQDIEGIERVLRRAKTLSEPVLIHVTTKKGQGYPPAENMPAAFHGTPPFRVETGEREGGAKGAAFGRGAAEKLTELARTDPRVVVVTAAMTEGVGFAGFLKEYPTRLFDVGIAEEHAVTMAAGLARGGMRPVVAIYDTFLQRAFDQIVEDVCLQNLPVLFLLDRAALSGHDGATHHGVFGLAYLTPVPNLRVLCPRSIGELEKMIDWAMGQNGPVAIRYPRLEDESVREIPCGAFAPGKWETLLPGKDLALLCVGPMVGIGLRAAALLKARGVQARVVNASSVKPLDAALLQTLDREGTPCYTLEECVPFGGFGSAVAALCAQEKWRAPRALVTLPDRFVPHGDDDTLLSRCGLSPEAIAQRISDDIKGARR